MNRQCLLLDLIEDPVLIAAYRAWHAPGNVPEAVIQDIRRRGITAMEIWHAGDRLVMLIEADDHSSAPPPAPAEPAVTAWETTMDQFQRRLPCAELGSKWTPTERIFNLSDHQV